MNEDIVSKTDLLKDIIKILNKNPNTVINIMPIYDDNKNKYTYLIEWSE